MNKNFAPAMSASTITTELAAAAAENVLPSALFVGRGERERETERERQRERGKGEREVERERGRREYEKRKIVLFQFFLLGHAS